jgi:hypothetical protein
MGKHGWLYYHNTDNIMKLTKAANASEMIDAVVEGVDATEIDRWAGPNLDSNVMKINELAAEITRICNKLMSDKKRKIGVYKEIIEHAGEISRLTNFVK